MTKHSYVWVYRQRSATNHVKYQFLKLIREGKVEGKRGLDRKKHSWLKNILSPKKLVLKNDIVQKAGQCDLIVYAYTRTK